MASAVLETLHRLQKAEGRGRFTREAFHEHVHEALERVEVVYPEGLLARLTREEKRLLDQAEGRIDSAARAGDFEAAEKALRGWERAWRETIRTAGGTRT